MRGSGKKSAHQKSGKSCSTKKETRSNIDISMQINDGSKISCAKKLRPKSKYHVRTGGSTSSNRTGTVPLIKRTGDGLVSKKPLTLPQDEKTSFLHCKGDKENASGDEKNENSKKRRERRKSKDKSGLDEAPRWQRRARYLLVKMKLEQNLIDAYSGEGWKGQSREKIRPEKELQRAKKQILKCKLGIRDAICQLELLSSVGCIEGSVIAPDGSVYHEHIICAKCELREAFPDNDIILCDGTCNRAFHQNCLDPPLATENIPPGDQGWLCNFCECKIDIIEAMNAHLGTYFSVNSSWQDIFKEEAALPDGGVALPNLEAEWPSDDSEDDDYDPENNEYRCSISRAGTEDGASDDANTSSSLSLSFEAEQFSGSGRLGNMREVSENNSVHLINSVDSDSTDGEILSGRRQRSSVDYKKLYDEMFGKDVPTNEQLSEDEDWGPAKRKRREKESDAASTLMTLCESEKKCPNVETMEIKKKFPPNPQRKRTLFRIPPGAVEKLRQVFSDNELPSRAVKENLSKELGIDSEKINKWFKNARYLALKTRKVEGSEVHSSIPRISKKSGSETVKNETCHPEGSKSTSSATLLHTPKNLKKFRRRNNPRSLTSPSKTTKLISAPLGSPIDSQKDNMEFSDDVSLKLLIAKSKMGKKRVNFETGGEVEAAEIEMERLCRIQGRLENMKQRFLGLQNENTDVWSVFYVPVAQLREKV